MAGPELLLPILLGVGAFGAGAAASGAFSSPAAASPTPPAAPQPITPAAPPATPPTGKPPGQSQQQSFLSGAAGAQLPGGGSTAPSPQKTLLGS